MPSPTFLASLGVKPSAVASTPTEPAPKPADQTIPAAAWRPTPCWSDVPAGAALPEGAEVWERPGDTLWARMPPGKRTPEDEAYLAGISRTFNDSLFPAPPPVIPPTTNLTAAEVAERAAAQHARFREAARKWHQFSAVADATSAAAKTLDERIAKGVAFCDRQAFAVQAAKGDTAKMVEADALLQEGQRQLAKLRDQRQWLAEKLALVEADLDREAAAMGNAEDSIRRALGDGAKGMCCSRCCGWIVDASAHWQVCK